MEFIRAMLEQQPLMALFLTIAIGYVVGEISIRGFSLGVGAVLFVALAMGWFAPKAAPAPMVGTLGLSLFLYAVGIQYGKQFFLGLTSAAGLRANLMALAGVLLSGAVSLLFVKTAGLDPGHALGLFAGSGTSTAALQPAVAKLGDDPTVGYSVSYPFGVAGPILFLYLTFVILKPKIEVPSGSGMELLEIALRNPAVFGRRLGELTGHAARAGADRGAAPRAPQSAGDSGHRHRRERRSAGRRPHAGRRSTRRARSWARRPPAASPEIAAISIISVCSRPGRLWWADCWAISTCRARRLRS